MPRKKKNGHSPARMPGLSNDINGYRGPGTDGAPPWRRGFNTDNNSPYGGGGTNMLPPTNPGGSAAHQDQDQDEVLRNMQEMFSHLDPEVLYIVLAECDFRVENAMDSLLELSVAAEDVGPLPPLLSGFELAAALLSPQHNPSKPDPHLHPPTRATAVPLSPPRPPPTLRSEDDQDLTTDLTKEFDVLIDRELENLTIQQEAGEGDHGGLHSSSSSASVPLSFLLQPPGPQQQALPQLLQSSPRASASRRGPPGVQPCPDRVLSAGQASSPNSPVSGLSLSFSGGAVGYQQQRSLLDFSHLTSVPAETDRTKPSLPLDLGASDRPSAFQAYRKLDQSTVPPEGGRAVPPGGIVGGARAKTSVAGGGGGEEERLNNSLFWNTQAPEFQPRIHGNQAGGPAFIVPVVLSPSPWHSQATPASHWLAQGPVSQAPVKANATIPRFWTDGVSVATAPRAPLLSGQHGRLRMEGRVLVLLRGAPGSGKSTLARAMLEQNPHGVVLSTDDYFCRHGDYIYDPSALGEAHEWNHTRAKEAMEASSSPVIIDNTNMQGWEMKPYVAMALRQDYKVLFRGPDTWWRNKPRELERRTKHNVPAEKIRWMMENYERHVTIHSIMGSSHPRLRPHNDPKLPAHQEPGPPNQDPSPPHQDPSPPNQDPGPPHQDPGPPNQDPGPPHQDPSLPHQDPSPPHQDPSPPHQDPSPPHQDPSPPHQDPSPPHQDPSPPHQDPSPPHPPPSPPHQDPSPPHQDPSPPHQDPSPPHQDPSPPHQDPSPPHQDPSPPHPPHQETSPPHQETSPPHQETSPPHQETSPPHQDPSPPHQDPSPPHQDPSPPHQDPSPPHPPHQDPSPPHQDPSPPHQDPSPPHQDPSPPHQDPSPPHPPHQETSPPHQDPSPPHQDPSPPHQDPSPPHPPHQDPSPPHQDPSPPHQDPSPPHPPHQETSPPHQDPSPPHQDPSPPHQDPSSPHQETHPSQPKSSDKPLVQGSERSRPQLFSSLPDVSSVGHSGRAITPCHSSAQWSTESLPSLREKASEKLGIPDNSEIPNEEDIVDLGALISELEESEGKGGEESEESEEGETGIPHCLVDSVFSADYHGEDERPVAFSESIGQRVRRERRSRTRKTDSERLEPADIVKDTSQSVSEGDGERAGEDGGGRLVAVGEIGERVSDVGERGRPELLDFVGDWPSEEVLGQRRGGGGRKGRHAWREGGSEGEEAGYRGSQLEAQPGSGPHVTEFQKLLELLQTGVDSFPLPTCPSPILSPSSARSLGEMGEAGGRRGEADSLISSRDGRDQFLNREELPDCVLADSSLGKEPTQLVESNTVKQRKGETIQAAGGGGTQGLVEEDLELEGSHLGKVSQCTDSDRHIGEGSMEAGEGSHVGEVSRCTDASKTRVEGEVGHLGGGSQERRQQQSRREGKPCKLALTFTHNTPPSPKPQIDLDLNPDLDITPDPKLDPNPQPHRPSPPPSLADTDRSSQTDPQDFAFLWRLDHNRHVNPTDAKPVAAGDHLPPNNTPTILHGNPSRFLPEVSAVVSAGTAVHPSGQRVVPYRVVHEKGNQVEERELEEGRTRQQNLIILRRHFKLVNRDTLEDLYDTCQQDLEWTSNMLLDSGERLFKGEEDDEEEGGGGGDEGLDMAMGVGLEVAPPGGQEVEVQPSASSCADSEGVVVLGSGEQEEEGWRTGGGMEGGLGGVSGLNHPVSGGGGGSEEENTVLGESTRLEPRPPRRDVAEQEVVRGSESGASTEQWEEWGRVGEEEGEGGDEELSCVDEGTQSLLAQLEEMEEERKGKRERERREEEEERKGRREMEKRRNSLLDIQSVELKLPTELALQLSELFGPVGVDPGVCSPDDYSVRMDLNMAKLLHQKWKDTLQEKQRQAALSYHLLQQSSFHWGESQTAKTGLRDGSRPAHFLIGADGFASLGGQSEAQDEVPIVDHWSVSRPHVSLRDVMTEEQALQENMERSRQAGADLDRRDGAAMLKETQLYDLFPSIDRHFLQDIFRDHNYCLVQTEQFLRSMLDEGPVRNVVAPEHTHRPHSKDRDKRRAAAAPVALPQSLSQYQDVEDPEYEDFRAEARLQRGRQLESFSKSAEAYRQGRKDVASYYAQQGHLHGQKMREANHRAAVQIFERVNSSLLPQNVLDLHGLHVDEALLHLATVLERKTTECQQGVCRSQLSVITGRGNHSQGGVARIRPAVTHYLNTHHYRFTEPKPGLMLVCLN